MDESDTIILHEINQTHKFKCCGDSFIRVLLRKSMQHKNSRWYNTKGRHITDARGAGAVSDSLVSGHHGRCLLWMTLLCLTSPCCLRPAVSDSAQRGL